MQEFKLQEQEDCRESLQSLIGFCDWLRLYRHDLAGMFAQYNEPQYELASLMFTLISELPKVLEFMGLSMLEYGDVSSEMTVAEHKTGYFSEILHYLMHERNNNEGSGKFPFGDEIQGFGLEWHARRYSQKEDPLESISYPVVSAIVFFERVFASLNKMIVLYAKNEDEKKRLKIADPDLFLINNLDIQELERSKTYQSVSRGFWILGLSAAGRDVDGVFSPASQTQKIILIQNAVLLGMIDSGQDTKKIGEFFQKELLPKLIEGKSPLEAFWNYALIKIMLSMNSSLDR
ncbi:MAG: hypothetical protein UX04_C0005G0012 [Microgenomates group bacterium GW2011_GWF2_45_18]|nr:MAG: hypothetical protein UW18_C0007G0013 [Microgenomates group bacterium GW2011_GWF1_44_10]KKU01593.1 MAG: hypothetical protein UX04_C0005G0012 [Microgenomates group bacterium GW2011_GWF2_45_18]HAU99526.1 hypothetical protein [Candidatus Paceibacterota bacterium]HAX01337.1 hypothetical protein [Candidatus Paceibacterota bacterium]